MTTVGILWRGVPAESAENARLQPVFEALREAGIRTETVIFDDDRADEVRQQILKLDGVLVWVDPVMGDRDRTVLDALLRDVSRQGVWVSSHPDVIMKMGTKEILALTRGLSCGSETYVYRSAEELQRDLPGRLQTGPRVLKRQRGNAGIGIWKVQYASESGADSMVEVQDAHPRGIDVETVPLAELFRRFDGIFADGGCLIDQPFQPRIADGMVRCYLVRDEVAGFARQEPSAEQIASGRVFGLPSRKTMFAADEARFSSLKVRMQTEWLPDILRLADVDRGELPMLWDADFFYGPPDETGQDTYILCEINVSSVIPFPSGVPSHLARAVRAFAEARASQA